MPGSPDFGELFELGIIDEDAYDVVWPNADGSYDDLLQTFPVGAMSSNSGWPDFINDIRHTTLHQSRSSHS